MNFSRDGLRLNSFLPEDLDPWGNLHIPSHVKEIAGFVFKGCTSLISISQSMNAPFPNDIDGIRQFAYEKDPAARKLIRVILHSEVTIIDSEAFQGCSNLRSIALVENMFLGCYAFKDCSKLEWLYIPERVHVGMYAFSHCENLKRVILSSAVQIDAYAFFECEQLERVLLVAKTPIEVVNLDSQIRSDDSLDFIEDTILVNNSRKTIGEGAFDKCVNLTEVLVPATTSAIEKWAFRSVSKACLIVLSTNTNLNPEAFGNAHQLLIVCPETEYDYVCAQLRIPAVICSSILAVRDKVLEELYLLFDTAEFIQKEKAVLKIPLPKGKVNQEMEAAFDLRIKKVLCSLTCIQELEDYVEKNSTPNRNITPLPFFLNFLSSPESKAEQEHQKRITAVKELIGLMSIGEEVIPLLQQKGRLFDGRVAEILNRHLQLELFNRSRDIPRPNSGALGLSAAMAVAAFYCKICKDKSSSLANYIGNTVFVAVFNGASCIQAEYSSFEMGLYL